MKLVHIIYLVMVFLVAAGECSFPRRRSFPQPGRHEGILRRLENHHAVRNKNENSVSFCKTVMEKDKLDCMIDYLERQEAVHQNPHLPQVNSNASSFVNVYDYGAKGDGKSDDTGAFQNALNDVGSAKGGTVYCPRGLFLFAGSLVVPPGVALLGTFLAVPSHAGLRDPGSLKPEDGTVFLPTANKGVETGDPFITLKEDATLRGAVIYYPEQVEKGIPLAYPFSIDMTGNNPAVIDVEILNSYQGIRAVGSGRHYIARVQGQPIKMGVLIDETYDIGRVEDVHFNPWFSMEKTFFDWQRTNGTAFSIARSDWEYVFNTFAFGYNIGYLFTESKSGACNGNFLGIGADYMRTASVVVEQSDKWGLLITNGEFTAFDGPDPVQIIVKNTNAGDVRIVNSAFWGPSNGIAQLEGSGTVSFGDCTFSDWDHAKTGTAAIDANGLSGALLLRGNDYQKPNAHAHVVLGKGLNRAVIVGNTYVGKEAIDNRGCQCVAHGLNAPSDGPCS